VNNRPASLTQAGVWLVSGGAKGVTAQCVIRLARQYQSNFILLGRSALTGDEPEWARGVKDDAELKRRIMAALTAAGEKATPAKIQKEFNALLSRRMIEGTLNAIREAGGQAIYCNADVTDQAELTRQIESITRQTGFRNGVLRQSGWAGEPARLCAA
jgi:NAD(P)-dependent dehydrogenase (short-subunit alcohol dehydrogenase family)